MKVLSAFLVLTLSVASASVPASAADAKKSTVKPIPAEVAKKAVERYVEIVRLAYADALKGAIELRSRINAFVAAPTAESLTAAREAWKAARDVYGPTEAFRFYGGPIDDPQDGPEGLMNAWPIDESYLDYVRGAENAGIINNVKDYPKITKEILVAANEKDGEKNISTGYHAIEFLLWGQDHSTTGPGERPHTDYVAGQGKNAERRGMTLKLLADLLVEHLTSVQKAWEPSNPKNYGDQLKKEPLDESLRRIYTGLITLSIDEMAGERMTVALERHDQEHEQDCFSDYTQKGMIGNEAGIRNVWYGTYGSTQGTGLHDIVVALDPKLAKQTEARIREAEKAVKAIPHPFDQVIAEKKKNGPKRKAAMRAISALEEQARSIAESGLVMGLVLNIQ